MKDWTKEYNDAVIADKLDIKEGERRKSNAEAIKKRIHLAAEREREKEPTEQ